MGVAVVHEVVGSKTGLLHPAAAVTARLRERWGPRVVLAADCCQLRCDLTSLRARAAQGSLVLLNASNFFAAPPCELPACYRHERHDIWHTQHDVTNMA